MKKFLIIGTLVATLVIALGAAGVAYAQTVTPGSESVVSALTEGFHRGRGGDRGMQSALRDYVKTATAEAFGLTVDELDALRDEGKSLVDVAIEQDMTVADFDAKMNAARQSAIEQAVADGVLTQEQADELAAIEAEREANRPVKDHSDSPLYTYMQTAIAEAFGISVEDLEAMQEAGTSLKDLAIEQDLTVAEYKSRIETARLSAIDAALADGVITQEEADAMKARVEDGVRLPGLGGMPGFGGHRGHGGRGGGHGECPTELPAVETTVEP
jgi:hypothetical protein